MQAFSQFLIYVLGESGEHQKLCFFYRSSSALKGGKTHHHKIADIWSKCLLVYRQQHTINSISEWLECETYDPYILSLNPAGNSVASYWTELIYIHGFVLPQIGRFVLFDICTVYFSWYIYILLFYCHFEWLFSDVLFYLKNTTYFVLFMQLPVQVKVFCNIAKWLLSIAKPSARKFC